MSKLLQLSGLSTEGVNFHITTINPPSMAATMAGRGAVYLSSGELGALLRPTVAEMRALADALNAAAADVEKSAVYVEKYIRKSAP